MISLAWWVSGLFVGHAVAFELKIEFVCFFEDPWFSKRATIVYLSCFCF